RTATGDNSDNLNRKHWDVFEYFGQKATLEIIDDANASHRPAPPRGNLPAADWGHIFVDDIVFRKDPYVELIGPVAAKEKLDASILKHWVDSLRIARADPNSPLYPWAVLSSQPLTVSSEAFLKRVEELGKKLQAQSTPPPEEGKHIAAEEDDYIVYEDFLNTNYEGWTVTGQAFGSGPCRYAASPYEVLMGNQLSGDPGRGYADSGRESDRLQGSMISPIFLSEKPYVHIRMAGTGNVGLNLVSDEFRAYPHSHGPFTADRFVWFKVDLPEYMDKFTYIEILDHDPSGHVVVDQILFSDKPEPPQRPVSKKQERLRLLILDLLTRPELRSLEDLAQMYQDFYNGALQQWQTDHQNGSDDSSGQRLMAWLMATGSYFGSLKEITTNLTDGEKQKFPELVNKRDRLEQSLAEPMFAMVTMDDVPQNTRIHVRGSHKNLGEEVPRRFLEVISGSQQPIVSQGSGRLDLARRMVDPSNPLLPRVMVNRIWKHHFGEGIVRSVDNFGIMGEKPTHAELLDYLSTEFVKRGWSIKQMDRLMVLSNTYQMSSKRRGGVERIDPLNKLLHHMPIRRLEAEIIRDAILAVAGRLDKKLYGPSVKVHLTSFMDGKGKPGKSGPLDGDGRRSIYINVRRNFLTPMFLAFDYPQPTFAIGRRDVSSVPAQALVMMNNEFVAKQAEFWANQVLSDKEKEPTERIRKMFVQAFARPPDNAELPAALDFLADQGKRYGDENERRVWADLCHVLFNAKEFIFVR
ncbi:DUF1553 domain-containing protein, partial [Acidobacteria bacterium AH-259-O06]|nr:DUF1553 domain-containing protein [Acidobacteria bacterium AH-259-O06]